MIVRGVVTRGRGIAKEVFGVPTANLVFNVTPNIAAGVYAGFVSIASHQKNTFPVAICIGADGGTKFEVHIFDFDGDLVGTTLDVEVLDRVSDIVPWESEEQMREKIQNDLETVQKFLQNE